MHFSFVFFFEEFTNTVYKLGLNMFVRCPLILWSECSAFRVSECVPTRKKKKNVAHKIGIILHFDTMFCLTWINLCLTQ